MSLSSLIERLTGSPSKSQANVTRQELMVSAFTRVESLKVSEELSTTPSLTTAPSQTDTSSESAEVSEETEIITGNHVGRKNSIGLDTHRSSVNQLHNLELQITTDAEDAKGLKVPLLSEGNHKSGEMMLKEGMQALDADWEIGSMPGDGLQLPTKEEEPQRRKSTRMDLLNPASTFMDKTSSVLGKRSREAIEAGMEKLVVLKGDKKRSRNDATKLDSQPLQGSTKRARASVAVSQEESAPHSEIQSSPAKKRPKTWLSQGLYAGQDPDFNPRLTETKNRMKKALASHKDGRRSAFMPLPMFAGGRALMKGRDFELPYNVYGPLPFKPPQPDAWKKTSKNVFVGDAADLWKKNKAQDRSLCTCPKDSPCGEDCLNRHMLYECDSNNCNAGKEHCTNRSFADLRARYNSKKGRKYHVGVDVIKTKDRGHGIRADRTFEPNQVIVEYTGEIITQEECDRRINTVYKNAECFYLMAFDQAMVIDATKGSIARFVNHSCDPNCRIEKWTVAGKPRMALFAGEKGIMTGEELTYDYRFDPFSSKKMQECRCGAVSCRGVLGPKPKEAKEALRPVITGKRKMQQMMGEVVKSVTKKRKIAVPTSVKSMFTSAKAQVTGPPSQPGGLELSTTQPKRLLKKDAKHTARDATRRKSTSILSAKSKHSVEDLSKRAIFPNILKNTKQSTKDLLKRGSISNIMADSTKEKSKDESRRRSWGNILPRGWKGWVLEPTPPPSPTEEEKAKMEQAGTKMVEMETKAARSDEGVVRTVRRSNRGPPGKSIRVIALGDDEMKGLKT